MVNFQIYNLKIFDNDDELVYFEVYPRYRKKGVGSKHSFSSHSGKCQQTEKKIKDELSEFIAEN